VVQTRTSFRVARRLPLLRGLNTYDLRSRLPNWTDDTSLHSVTVKQVVQMPIMRVAEGCSVGRAPTGSTTEDCEALLEQYDAVVVSKDLMITYIDCIPGLTGGVIPNWMTDQLGAELQDPGRVEEMPRADGTEWRAT
jgi:hypothetical protein